ncbi:MAG: NAD(P)/FAD-dependent oxidoreductase [Candidatus Lokiarchaeota archaeon]|nr:NAD(P)/FAD-dependent oxidoreductase [Candidatus Lokiarchaeota archaeon]
MKKYDLLIVGAGAAGTIAAYFAAKKGFNVCLLDGKPKEKIGDKICGDGIGSQIFDNLGIPHPKKGEYLNIINGSKLYPPDSHYCITIKDRAQAGYIIDRLQFGQRLMLDAIDAGAELFDNTHALSPLYDKEQIIGVRIKSKILEEKELRANVIIDASGFHTPLRRKIDFPFLDKEISPTDYIVCYREILKLKNPVVVDQNYISIYMDNQRAPGGYIWYFPRNENEVNLGFGVSEKYKDRLIEYYQKYVYKPFIGKEICTKINGGSGLVSVCKPLFTGVANGILFVGDAAMQVNPITGGGLFSSMQAGYFAIQAYEKAEALGKYDALALWNYNLLSQKTIAAEFAPLDLLRVAIQKFPNDVLNFVLKKQLITSEEIIGITATGELPLPIGAIIGKVIRGLSNPSILMDLYYLRNQMQEIKAVYRRYPSSPAFLSNWVQNVRQIYTNVQKKFV